MRKIWKEKKIVMKQMHAFVKPWQVKLQEMWSQMAARERRAVAIAAPVVIFFIVYQWVWSPLIGSVDYLRQRITTQQKTLEWMQNADQDLQKMQGHQHNKAIASSPVVLLGALQKQIRQSGLQQYVTELKQSNNDGVEVHFQKVEFDKLVQLLITMNKTESFIISHMTTTSLTTQGLVNADLSLRLTS